MGRRPNAVVSEYFIRGQKLNDASNRYSHTCRKCEEVFPKGRVDNLVSHLLRRCPMISQDDRQTIYQAIQQQNPDAHRVPQHSEPPPILPPANATADAIANPLVDHTTDLPVSLLTTRDQDRLHTLAEASVIAGGDPPEQPMINDPGHGIAENDFMAQMQTAANMTTFPSGQAPPAVMYVSDGMGQIQQPVDTAVNAALAPSPLVQAASAANEELEQFGQQNQYQAAIDQQLEESVTDPSLLQPSQANGNHGPVSWGPTNASNTQAFGNMTTTMRLNDTEDGMGELQATGKNRSRGRFNDTRRKEVQEIRKQGACMRCRMLKKPCSEGTPCKTCKGVETARLWKGTCVRMRLADVFTLWTTSLFHSKAKIEVQAAVRGLDPEPMDGRVEVRLFPNSDLAMAFTVKKYSSTLVRYRATMEENIAAYFRDKRPDPQSAPHDIWLLDETDMISAKMGEYIGGIADVCIAEEQTPFFKSTLQRAQDMVRQELANGYNALQSQTGRSSYTLQNELLKNTVELWVATTMLTLRTPAQLETWYNPTEHPSHEPVMVQWSGQPSAYYTSIPAKSRELILAQIRAAMEHRCAGLSKVIMNELERRLLQRSQVSRFPTVVSSAVLLNCIERMTGLYRSVDPGPSPPPRRGEASASEAVDFLPQEDAPLRPSDWPLDSPPRTLWPQGELFADLLIMLLRTRNLPPQTTTTADGKLIVSSQGNPQVMTINRSVKEQANEQTKLPAAWLNHLGLKQSDLVKIRDGRMPSGDQGVREWDMKFISRLLLPETAK